MGFNSGFKGLNDGIALHVRPQQLALLELSYH